MTIKWNEIFDQYGVKTVTKTDKAKAAYVPNSAQRQAIEAAGIVPAITRPAPDFSVTVLYDAHIDSVRASYYYSERVTSPGRSPEPRMGHGFISSWLNVNDQVVVGNIGSQVFAAKLASAPATEEAAIQAIIRRASQSTILERAKAASGKPAQRESKRSDFVRNPYVVAAALIRSSGKCEMPGCGRALFTTDDGSLYLEVHHVVPLSENGDDTLDNVAALCPHCHREQHSGIRRKEIRKILRGYISSLNDK